jgi:hypothetical protein
MASWSKISPSAAATPARPSPPSKSSRLVLAATDMNLAPLEADGHASATSPPFVAVLDDTPLDPRGHHQLEPGTRLLRRRTLISLHTYRSCMDYVR